MTKKSSSKAKPDVAFALEAAAKGNIETKLRKLEEYVRIGVPVPGMPTSLRKFNAWEIAGSSGEGFLPNANETLARHPAMKSSAIALVRIVKELSKVKKSAREIGVSRARERSDLHLAIRRIAETELLRAKERIKELGSENQALRNQNSSLISEATRLREEFEAALLELREKNAELIGKGYRNLRPIR